MIMFHRCRATPRKMMVISLDSCHILRGINYITCLNVFDDQVCSESFALYIIRASEVSHVCWRHNRHVGHMRLKVEVYFNISVRITLDRRERGNKRLGKSCESWIRSSWPDVCSKTLWTWLHILLESQGYHICFRECRSKI